MSESNDDAQLGLIDVALASVLAGLWLALVRPGPIDLAYFWDEADVYVPGARWVAEHGLNVTPGVFPDDYSRGHPPLLYLIAGAAFAAWGSGPLVGHLLILPMALLALAGTYLLGAQLFGRRAGCAAALLLGATPLFMTMGNMLLPEMPLTALAVLSLLAFARGRLGIAAGLGIAAVLVKETGIFAAAAIGAAVLFDSWRAETLRSPATARRAFVAALPLLALMGFFAWQRATAGYFIFPHHQNLFADRPFVASNLVTVFPSLLLWHGRWIVVAGAVLALVMLRGTPTTRSVASPPSLPSSSDAASSGGSSSDAASLPAASSRAALSRPGERWVPARSSVLFAFAMLIAFNAAFFAKMFWLERYLLPAHPGLLIGCAGALFALSGRRVWFASVLVLACAVVGVISLYGPAQADSEEHTFAYADVIATHRSAFADIDAEINGESSLVVTTWPMSVELRFPYLGYVDVPRASVELQYLSDEQRDQATHVLVSSTSAEADSLRELATSLGLRRLGGFQVDDAPPLELYGR